MQKINTKKGIVAFYKNYFNYDFKKIIRYTLLSSHSDRNSIPDKIF